MSTQRMGVTGTRLLLIFAVGLLVVAAWYGGRWSAGARLPFDMMSDRMHDGPMQGRHMQGPMQDNGMRGDGGGAADRMRNGTEDFDGEMGRRRCRAMMGTMTGMHRSMESMMGGAGHERWGEGSGGWSDQKMKGRHGMGGMHGGGTGMMGHRSHEELSATQMRDLCRTMHEAMRTAMHGDPGGGPSAAADSTLEAASLGTETTQWLRGARGFEAIADRRGQDEVVVEVGAGDGLQYGPVAVRVDPGTTIRWRWTGKGGLHNVDVVNAEISTELRGEKGAEFTHTFNEPGAYRYECTPHAGVGMRGAVIVADDA
jgi:halocyanin-like protein